MARCRLNNSRCYVWFMWCWFSIMVLCAASSLEAQTSTPTITPSPSPTATYTSSPSPTASNTPTPSPTAPPALCGQYAWCNKWDYRISNYGGVNASWTWGGNGGYWDTAGWHTAYSGSQYSMGVYQAFDYPIPLGSIKWMRVCYFASGGGRSYYGVTPGIAWDTSGSGWTSPFGSASGQQGGYFCDVSNHTIDLSANGSEAVGIYITAGYIGGTEIQIKEIWLAGDNVGGQNPWFFPTATPVPTLVPTATAVPGLDYNEICPQSNVNPLDVSSEYVRECSHCLEWDYELFDYGTGVPTRVSVTPASGSTPSSSRPTSTPVVRVGTVTPAPNPSWATATPIPYGLTCDLTLGVECDWVHVTDGSLLSGTGVLGVALPGSSGFNENRAVVEIAVPSDSEYVQGVVVQYTLDTPSSYSGLTAYYRAVNKAGTDIGSSWLIVGEGSSIVELNPQSQSYGAWLNFTGESLWGMTFGLVSDRVEDPAVPSGVAIIERVEILYSKDWLPANRFSDQPVDCSAPNDYPQLRYDEGDYFGFDAVVVPHLPQCRRIFPGLPLGSILNSLTSFVGLGEWFGNALGLPAVDLCIYWVELGAVSLFGLNFSLGFFINVLLLSAFVRWIRSL